MRYPITDICNHDYFERYPIQFAHFASFGVLHIMGYRQEGTSMFFGYKSEGTKILLSKTIDSTFWLVSEKNADTFWLVAHDYVIY